MSIGAQFGVKGRRTIRKAGGKSTRLWEQATSKNPTVRYLDGLGAVDRAEARHAANRADTRFTPDGVRDDVMKHVLADAVPALHRGRMAIRKAKAEIAERKSKLKLDGPPKDDVAAAFRRMEIRTHLKDMSSEQQSKYFSKYEGNMPPEILQAVTELPPEYPRPAHGCAEGRDRAEVSRGEYGERPRPRAWKRISEMAQRCAWQKSPNAICRKSTLPLPV